MEVKSQTTLPITVDKSHITTLGERLYTESIELIRELVNNAYDADATRVKVTIRPDMVKVEDDGAGMDGEGLQQYFNIGSPEKLQKSKSPVYKRDRIGQFGIGKFASLAACQRFEVYTQRKQFAARVTFDKDIWTQSSQHWDLPMEILAPDTRRGDGTTVTLSRLTRTFDPDTVRQKILESVPIQAQNFAVYVNGKRVVFARIPGHRLPFLEGTVFGPVHGEIVLVPASQAAAKEMGIGVRVKGVMVKTEYFGIQTWGKEGARVRGEANADFLVVTSDRSGFRVDTPEYEAFVAAMEKVMSEVQQQVGRLSDKKETQKVKRALKEAIERIQLALGRHPDFIEAGLLPVGEESDALGEPGQARPAEAEMQDAEMTPESENGDLPASEEADGLTPENTVSDAEGTYETGPAKEKAPVVKRLTPNTVIRKISVGDHLVSCCLDHFGEDDPECFTQGQIIYINRDHPLYKRESKQKASHTMYLARLLSQEIAMMKTPADPRAAFEKQSELLKAAFSE
ncbi:MAG: ATP-binding protein [bacterium]